MRMEESTVGLYVDKSSRRTLKPLARGMWIAAIVAVDEVGSEAEEEVIITGMATTEVAIEVEEEGRAIVQRALQTRIWILSKHKTQQGQVTFI